MSESQSVLHNSQCMSQPDRSSLCNCNDILEGVEAFGGSHSIQVVEHGQHEDLMRSSSLRPQ